MKVCITEHSHMPTDLAGSVMPIAGKPVAKTKLTAAGGITVSSRTRFVKVSTDTAIHVGIGEAASDACDMVSDGGADFFAVRGGDAVNIIVA